MCIYVYISGSIYTRVVIQGFESSGEVALVGEERGIAGTRISAAGFGRQHKKVLDGGMQARSSKKQGSQGFGVRWVMQTD